MPKKEDPVAKFHLSNLNIVEIADCGTPAVPDATFQVFKSSDVGDGRVPVVKFTPFIIKEAERKTGGYVYVPDKADVQGDISKTADVVGAKDSFMVNLGKRLQKGTGSSANHNEFDVGTYVVTSIIDQDGSVAKMFGAEPIPGGWWIEKHYTDDAEWQKVVTGEYTGYSIGGSGERTPLEDGILKKFVEEFKSFRRTVEKAVGINKAYSFEEYYRDNIMWDGNWAAFDALSWAIWSILVDEDITDKVSAIDQACQAFNVAVVDFYRGLTEAAILKQASPMETIHKAMAGLKTQMKKQEVDKTDHEDGGDEEMALDEKTAKAVMERLGGIETNLATLQTSIGKSDTDEDTDAAPKPDAEAKKSDADEAEGDDGDVLKQVLARIDKIGTTVDELQTKVGKMANEPTGPAGDIDPDIAKATEGMEDEVLKKVNAGAALLGGARVAAQ